MTTVAQMRLHLDELEAIQRRLGDVSRRTDPDRANDLVAGRRALAAALAAVMTDGDALFGGAGNPATLREFRQRFATMRAAVVTLQADWPAVRVRNEGGADYAAAVAAVRASDQAVIAWTRTALDRLDAPKGARQ